MPQLQKGTTYTGTGVSSFVTHTNLNAHVDNAKLLGGAIDEQVANSVSTDQDLFLINKGGDLFKQTKGQLLQTINTELINVNNLNAEQIEVDDVGINDTLQVGGAVSIGENLAVTGVTTLTGGIDGNLVVTGTITAKDEAPTADSQLVNKKYVDGVSSMGQIGYSKLPNGLIMQWGRSTGIAPLSTQTQTFPIPFPTACFNVQATKITTHDYFGNKKDTHAVHSFTKTGFGMFNQHEMVSAEYNWFAIGN